jgi:ribosome-binding protein aMBF1 (putative translation factor)
MSLNGGLAHQDWETLYLNCKVDKKEDKKTKSIKKSENGERESKMDELIDEGKMSHKKVSVDLKDEFKKWRNSKGMTQKQVGIMLAVNHQVINKFETGNMNHDPKLVGKIKRLMSAK